MIEWISSKIQIKLAFYPQCCKNDLLKPARREKELCHSERVCQPYNES